MAARWMFYVFTVLCYNTRPQIIFAEKYMLGSDPNPTKWILESGQNGTVQSPWNKVTSTNVLKAVVGSKLGSPSEAWFITKVFDIPETSYLNISAKCTSEKFCSMKIYATKDRSSYIDPQNEFHKFELKQTMTFTVEKQNTSITNITKGPYTRVGFLVQAAKEEITWIVNSINMYHYICENSIKNIAVANVNASTTNKSVPIQCSNNSVSSKDYTSQNITITCSPQGKWIKSEECVCNPGFAFKSSKCSRCQKNEYKAQASNTECSTCSDGKTNNAQYTQCRCEEDRYIGDDENGACYAVPSAVDVVNITPGGTSVNISWSRPQNDGGFNGTLSYNVECYRCNQSTCDVCKNATSANLDTDARFSPNNTNLIGTSINIFGLTFNETYWFRIISKNSCLKNVSIDKWKCSQHPFKFPLPTTNETKEKSNGKSNLYIFIGAGAAFVLIVLLIILVVIRKLRRSKSSTDGSVNCAFELALPTIGQKMYVDPSNYDDPEAAIKDFASEIFPKSLHLERVLGGGEFGDVYKGTLKTEHGSVIEIAAKTLKHDSDQRSRKDFFLEASAMGQFDDPHVIRLEGVITKSVPHMIITEYMSNGSLDNFLKQNDENLTDLQLVGMARGVASGMKYLASMNFVHRDLAARNILVNDTLLCKVADFGLSRELETTDSSQGEYCTTGGKIPVRWTAPESIKYRKFSTASDVWSYGILLWEIMSFAERPYWDWDNFKVLERVDEGYRLPAPKNCPKAVHELMLLCWETDRSQRPKFPDIVRMLDDWIRSPETIRYEKIRPLSGSGLHDPSILIKEWLNDIKMSSYIPHFTQAGFTQLADLAGLQDIDLRSLGVTLVGHRNKMLRTIRLLPITDQSKKIAWNRAQSLKV